MKDKLHEDIKHYIRVLEDYQWAMKELYEARIELDDIAKEFQPVKSVSTDRQVIENYRMTNEDMILDKVFREERAIAKRTRAIAIVEEANMIMDHVLDSLEKEMIKDFYTKRGFSKYDFSAKYGYEQNSIYNKIYWIIKKAAKRIEKLK